VKAKHCKGEQDAKHQRIMRKAKNKPTYSSIIVWSFVQNILSLLAAAPTFERWHHPACILFVQLRESSQHYNFVESRDASVTRVDRSVAVLVKLGVATTLRAK